VDKIIEKYLTMPWEKIKIDELLYETFNIAFLNQIKIPREFALIAKALGTIQGFSEKLAPDFNSLVVAKPIAKKLIYQSFSAERVSQEIKKDFRIYRELFKVVPSTILNILEKMDDDNFTLQHEIKDIANIQKSFNKGINRMSFSIVLLAVSIIIAGVIIGSSLSAGSGEVMNLLNIRVLKTGLAFAIIIILGLIISVLRANRL